MAGFHRQPGKERFIRGIRQPAAARALVVRCGDFQAAVVSLDMLAVSRDVAGRVGAQVEKATGISSARVWVCATHSHSMPTLRYCRQWGAIDADYLARTEKAVVRAVAAAADDLAPAQLRVGRATADGANFNRTTDQWRAEEAFDADATADQRWLDRHLHVVKAERAKGKPDLLWYHFSAHPVCYTDDQAGPDWPGLVAEQIERQTKLRPSLLQGHCGDVNPGPGKPWLGVAEDVAAKVSDAIARALDSAEPIAAEPLQAADSPSSLPLDLELFGRWIEQYRSEPEKCQRGRWVDARFAADWFEGAQRWNMQSRWLTVPLGGLRIGPLALVFHPAELYSYYGLTIRRQSPAAHTLVVGYANDCIGYLADPKAYEAGEYAALTVPKILDLPPFEPAAAGALKKAALQMLDQLWS